VSIAVVVLFTVAGVALGASSFTDATGDGNEAPDIVSVKVARSVEAVFSVAIAVDNFGVLPENSWINLWFDLDSNQETGDEGDEALVRYSSGGELEFYLWDGARLQSQPVAGMTAAFADGVLSLTTPARALDDATTFGLLAVASRGQDVGGGELIASDFAPDSGRSSFVGPEETDFPDPGHDHDAAPDITSIQLTDAKNGWISFVVSTPNYERLPTEAVLALVIDRDNRPTTGDDGVELSLTTAGGEFTLERWDAAAKRWRADEKPTRVRVTNTGNVVRIDIHSSELANTPQFGFGLVAADVNVQADAVLGIDVAPDTGRLYRYRLANKPALLLTATSVFGTPSRPRAGKPFTVNLAVQRSDTSRPITSGTVTCRTIVAGKRVVATGSVSGGAGHCRMLVPNGAGGSTLRGTISVRTDGKTVTKSFTFVVR
jgi:hypothetical protein